MTDHHDEDQTDRKCRDACMKALQPGSDLDMLIAQEVAINIKANPNMTAAACTTTCDAMFNMTDHHDEDQTDRMCQDACMKALGPAVRQVRQVDPHHGHDHSAIHDLIKHEVHSLVHADHDLDVAGCTVKCDAMFDLMAADDENVTDMYCAQECMKSIHNKPVRQVDPMAPHHGHDHSAIHDLIKHEVHSLVHADPALDVAGCTVKCDAMFDLMAADDENVTDMYCAQECQHSIHNKPVAV